MSFKLLAIRPLEGCEEHIKNNLQLDQFYFFDDAYEQFGEYDFIKKKENYNELNPEFYYSKNENLESTLQSININAIVGKNGSGKSSIIEFLLRLLNNFFKGIDEHKKLENLICVEGIVGELYILQAEKLYKIYMNFSIIKDNQEGTDKKNKYREYINILEIPQIINDDVLNRDGFKNQSYNNEIYSVKKQTKFKIDDYFFTMYVNYSLYGLDEKDFENEDSNIEKSSGSWLNKIFHKNDGYQTPVVIHPYRESAMIDVRREKDLMKQRLAALIFTNDEYRKVIPQYNFDEIRFRLKTETALDHFLEHIFDSQESEIVKGDIFKNYISKEILDEKIMFLSEWIDGNESLLEYIKEKNKKKNEDYNLKYYLYAAYAFIRKIAIKEFKAYEKYENTDKISLNVYIFAVTSEPEIAEHIKKNIQADLTFTKILSKTSNMSIETLISLIQLTISYEVFIKHFGYEKNEIDFELNETDRLEYRLFWYCVVKSIKTLKYNTNKFFSESFDPRNIFDLNTKKLDSLAKRYFVDIIRIDKSHITDKLRRTILLLELINNPIKDTNITDNKKEAFSSSNLIDYYREIVNNSLPYKWIQGKEEFSRNITELGDLINNTKTIYSRKNIELTDLLPPAIFDYDFYSSTKEGEEKIPLSKISSGQFQKIGLLSSVVYHLKNLDSIQDRTNLNAYKQVLVVLDEIELYFHPEQQREFIYDLVRLLKSNKFKKIENLNIFFITHSPFILSDIPSQNVLKLDKGKPFDIISYNSFGANIHDLLADEFFLDNGFIGDFAKEKIQDVVEYINYEERRSEKRWITTPYVAKKLIEQIGEPYLADKLNEMFLESFPEFKDAEIKKLEERLNQLKNGATSVK